MIKTGLVIYPSMERRNITYFEDDTIDIVRQQISKSVDIHPDRLFCLVGVKLDRNYYTRDSRNWSNLFFRLSLNGTTIPKETFTSYCKEYRLPNIDISYQSYDHAYWMEYPEQLRDIFEPVGDFTEYRILGVKDIKSYILPLNINTIIVSRIPSAQLPIPEGNLLLSSLYDVKSIQGFLIEHYVDKGEIGYFPNLRTVTPARLSLDQIKVLDSNSKLLTDLLKLDPPVPKSKHILRARWKINLVDTDFGDAIQTRFEQLFYGVTVSKDVPCVTYFTSRTEISRHKFYTEDSKSKKTYIDMPMWNQWWNTSKAFKTKPTLIFYRGKSKQEYDRIAVSSTDIVFTSYRTDDNTDELEELRTKLLKWYEKIDAINAFVKISDIQDTRWNFEEVRFIAKYGKEYDELDERRMNCITGLFDLVNKKGSVFRLLRSDYSADGLSPIDIGVLQILKENPAASPTDIEQTLGLTRDQALRALNDMQDRLEEDPDLLDRAFRGFPSIRIGLNSVEITNMNEIERPLSYANILRYVLTEPENSDIEKVCPKRLERVEAETMNVPIGDIEFEDSDEFGDLFAGIEEQKEPEIIEQQIETKKKIKTTGKSASNYSVFFNKLREFDPETYDFPGTRYPKECEQTRQPIVLSESELAKLPKDYDPRTYEDEKKILNVADPNGILICPAFWCLYDGIPLREDQLITVDGKEACPVCKRKLRSAKDDKSSIQEYSVIKRVGEYFYPKLLDYVSPQNGKRMPCCYKTSREKKTIKEDDDEDGKFYLLGETKTDLKQFRLSYVSKQLLGSIQIKEDDYSGFTSSNNRIQSGMSGFFRVGLGRPSISLPTLFNLKAQIPEPKDSLNIILKCSFTRYWTKKEDKHFDEIQNDLKKFSPFDKNDLARENMAKIISGINEAYNSGQLPIMYELEYVAIILQIDLFRIYTDTQQLGCIFYTRMVRPRSRGAIILQRGQDVDILCNVSRKGKAFQYKTNIFQEPFKKETYLELEKLRTFSCKLTIPTFTTAMRAFQSIDEFTDEFLIQTDPYGRAQAIYVPDKVYIPFQSAVLYEVIQPKTTDLSNLPPYKLVKTQLQKMKQINEGYEWESDIHDSNGNIVEVLTKSGLRIPVVPEASQGENLEVTRTVGEIEETNLVFGSPLKEDKDKYTTISYESEVFDFLLFELSKELKDNANILEELKQQKISRKDLEPILKKWFDSKIMYVSDPIQFVSKVRTPCGQLKNKETCESANMCGWNGKTCGINVNEKLRNSNLFHRLLTTLVENSKLRAIVLDGRVTPFFSTILYLQLPNEIILTDLQLKIS